MTFRFAHWTSLVFIVFFGAIFLFGVSARAARFEPIYNVTNHPLPVSAQRLPPQTIQQAIVDAALSYHWRIDSKGPGTIGATYQRGKHQAVIAITYSQTAYSITLVRTSGMHQKTNGEINYNYNSWVRKLETRIEDRLSAASASTK